jgi:hypothetical protein
MMRLLILAASGALVLSVAASPARGDDATTPVPIAHRAWRDQPVGIDAVDGSTADLAAVRNPPNPVCTTASSDAANVSTDCDPNSLHNETSIAVNPTNPLNIVGGANDLQLTLNPGGQVHNTSLWRAHVSSDGGKTWTMVAIDSQGYQSVNDPSVAFDADGTAYDAGVAYGFGQTGGSGYTNPDLIVAHSADGGVRWSPAAIVAKGSGSTNSAGIFNDKEAIAAWGHGNAIVTWTVYTILAQRNYQNGPVFASVTHDSGRTWTEGVEISGSAPFCYGFNRDDRCDLSPGSVPIVASDGSIYVALLTFGDITTLRDRYAVVKLDPATGRRVAGPVKVADLVDGATDYPLDPYGGQVYQDSEFRTWPFGNITADPTNASHLTVIWSDMRDSTLPAPSDPYQATTNSDVVVSQSFDGAVTWSAPVALKVAGDQFMPWGSYGPDGRLRIGYFDRSYDPANHKYGYTLATETTPSSLTFTTTQLSTALSDPTMNDRFFAGTTFDPAFPHPTRFLGDYSEIDASQPNLVAALWTDMRTDICFTTRCGAGQDAMFAKSS